MIDPNLSGRFFLHPKPTHNGGVEEAVYISIRAKGLKSVHSREMKDTDKLDFPVAWHFFETNETVINGTPLKALPGGNAALVQQLNAVDIYSVEELAELQELSLVNIRQGRTLQKRANAYLAALQIEDEADEVEEEITIDEDVKPIVANKKSTRKKTKR